MMCAAASSANPFGSFGSSGFVAWRLVDAALAWRLVWLSHLSSVQFHLGYSLCRAVAACIGLAARVGCGRAPRV